MEGRKPAQRDRDGYGSCKLLVPVEDPICNEMGLKLIWKMDNPKHREREKTCKKETAKRGCGWRANRREREQETSTVCTSLPPSLSHSPSSSFQSLQWFSRENTNKRHSFVPNVLKFPPFFPFLFLCSLKFVLPLTHSYAISSNLYSLHFIL